MICPDCEKKGEKIKEIQDQLHKKNIELDALRWVWCSGGCDGGVGRYTTDKDLETWAKEHHLTEEMVKTAEHNTERLRTWFNNYKYKTGYQESGRPVMVCAFCGSNNKDCPNCQGRMIIPSRFEDGKAIFDIKQGKDLTEKDIIDAVNSAIPFNADAWVVKFDTAGFETMKKVKIKIGDKGSEFDIPSSEEKIGTLTRIDKNKKKEV